MARQFAEEEYFPKRPVFRKKKIEKRKASKRKGQVPGKREAAELASTETDFPLGLPFLEKSVAAGGAAPRPETEKQKYFFNSVIVFNYFNKLKFNKINQVL